MTFYSHLFILNRNLVGSGQLRYITQAGAHHLLSIPDRNKLLTSTGGLIAICLVGCFLAYKIVHIPLQAEMILLFSVAIFYPILRQPATGVYLLFILTPFVAFFRRLYYLLHQRPTADPLIITGDLITCFTLIGLFFALKEQSMYRRSAPITKNIILIYFFYLFIRVFFLNSLPIAEALLRYRFYGPAILLFFIGSYYARNTLMLKRIWIITIIIGIVGALYGFNQLFFGYSVAEKLWFSNISFTTLFIKGLARPFSLFQSPAAFADYMQIAIVGVLIVSSNTTLLHRLFLLPLLALFFYGALITSVRSNWIGIALSLLIWYTVLIMRKSSQRIAAIATLCLLFCLLQLFGDLKGNMGVDTLFQKLAGGFNQQNMDLLVTERSGALSNPFEEYSFLSRMNLWKYIISLSVDPVMALLGRGVGVLNADSLYFTYLAEFGYPGMLFIIWVVFYTIRKGFVFIHTGKDPTQVAIIKGITLMNIVFAVINITGTHIHSFPGDVFFWFWNGVLIEITARATTNTVESDNAATPL